MSCGVGGSTALRHSLSLLRPLHPAPLFPAPCAAKISEGAESSVFLGQWQGQAVAVKKARMSTSADLDRFRSELAMLAGVRDHPGIVRLLGAYQGCGPHLQHWDCPTCRRPSLRCSWKRGATAPPPPPPRSPPPAAGLHARQQHA